jgi:tetratricopeptide (TPR) repeat protein
MRAQELEGELSRVAEVARQRGLPVEAARAYYLMSFVHNERGDLPRARAMTLQAAQASRTADVDTLQQQLANTGRCLAHIERDVARADEFLHEAEALGQKRTGRTALEMTWGRGLVYAFDGLDEAAVPLLERAAALAEVESDHWATTQALTRVARLALEGGRPGEALERCRGLEPVVAKLGAGSEAPFIRALAALSRLELGEPEALVDVERALKDLRLVDSKAHVAYVLNALADHDANSGRVDEARRRAEEALAAAEAVGHRSEAAVARSRLALSTLDREVALTLIRACGPDWANLWVLSARARASVGAAAERFGVERPDAEP